MSAPTPTSEPSTLVAGDTISWTRSLADYPASDGWTLSYAMRLQQGSGAVNATASPVGADFSITIAATATATMTPGLWSWAAYVTKAAERYQVGYGSLTVKPNLAVIDYQTDLRSSAKRAYDNALAAWESVKLGQTVMLNGRTYTQFNISELILYVDRCKADYAQEQRADQFEQTGINTRRIGVGLQRV